MLFVRLFKIFVFWELVRLNLLLDNLDSFECTSQCKLYTDGAGPLNGALSAWQANRCTLKVLMDGNLKNGLI